MTRKKNRTTKAKIKGTGQNKERGSECFRAFAVPENDYFKLLISS